MHRFPPGYIQPTGSISRAPIPRAVAVPIPTVAGYPQPQPTFAHPASHAPFRFGVPPLRVPYPPPAAMPPPAAAAYYQTERPPNPLQPPTNPAPYRPGYHYPPEQAQVSPVDARNLISVLRNEHASRQQGEPSSAPLWLKEMVQTIGQGMQPSTNVLRTMAGETRPVGEPMDSSAPMVDRDFRSSARKFSGDRMTEQDFPNPRLIDPNARAPDRTHPSSAPRRGTPWYARASSPAKMSTAISYPAIKDNSAPRNPFAPIHLEPPEGAVLSSPAPHESPSQKAPPWAQVKQEPVDPNSHKKLTRADIADKISDFIWKLTTNPKQRADELEQTIKEACRALIEAQRTGEVDESAEVFGSALAQHAEATRPTESSVAETDEPTPTTSRKRPSVGARFVQHELKRLKQHDDNEAEAVSAARNPSPLVEERESAFTAESTPAFTAESTHEEKPSSYDLEDVSPPRTPSPVIIGFEAAFRELERDNRLEDEQMALRRNPSPRIEHRGSAFEDRSAERMSRRGNGHIDNVAPRRNPSPPPRAHDKRRETTPERSRSHAHPRQNDLLSRRSDSRSRRSDSRSQRGDSHPRRSEPGPRLNEREPRRSEHALRNEREPRWSERDTGNGHTLRNEREPRPSERDTGNGHTLRNEREPRRSERDTGNGHTLQNEREPRWSERDTGNGHTLRNEREPRRSERETRNGREPRRDEPQPMKGEPHPHRHEPHPRRSEPHLEQAELERHPRRSEPYPLRDEPHPEQTEHKAHPRRSEPYSRRGEPHPEQTKHEPHPRRSEPYPRRNEPYPLRDEPHPRRSEPHPRRNEPHPLKNESQTRRNEPKSRRSEPNPRRSESKPQMRTTPDKMRTTPDKMRTTPDRIRTTPDKRAQSPKKTRFPIKPKDEPEEESAALVTKNTGTRNVYVCPFCDCIFDLWNTFRNHLEHESGFRPLFCCFCDEEFETHGALLQHIPEKHTFVDLYESDKKKCRCPWCRMAFESRSEVRKHLDAIHLSHPEMPFFCSKCSERFAEFSLLWNHTEHFHEERPLLLMSSHSKRLFDVAALSRDKKSKEDLSKEQTGGPIRQSFDPSKAPAPDIPATVLQGELRKRKPMMGRNAGRKGRLAYKCPFCNICFRNWLPFQNHLEHELGVRPYICAFCDIEYPNSAQLIYHVTKSHQKKVGSFENEARNVRCPWCRDVFSTQQDVRVHMISHLDNLKAFSCDLCPSRFADSNLLRCHLRLTHGERPILLKHSHQKVLVDAVVAAEGTVVDDTPTASGTSEETSSDDKDVKDW